MNISIREVKRADADFLTQILNIPEIMHRLHMTPTMKQDWVEAIQSWEEDKDERDYIVLEGEKPIGWFALNGLESGDRKAYLKMAVLLPENQGRGVGLMVINQLVNELRVEGYKKVGLFTDLDNLYAQRCYSKCGFQRVSTLEEEMPDGICLKRLEMERNL